MSYYKARAIDAQLDDWLEAVGAVLIQGTKWCGKTTTASFHSKSSLYMDDPASKTQNLQMAAVNPSRLLEGETPRMIDEWELAPQLWDAARFEVDHRESHTGQFIFTGSATPKDKDREKIFHSGTGRFAWLTMRPMSLWESGESSGEVSLAAMFAGDEPIANKAHVSIDDLAFLICRGGWPGTLGLSAKAALKIPHAYLDGVVNSDVNRVDDVNRNPLFMRNIIKSLARNQGGQIPISTIYSDLSINAPSLSVDTIEDYVNVLKKIFLEEDMPAWNPNLRSKTAIRTSDTRYFVDPSIAAAALEISPTDLINNLDTFGLLFETLAVRDLRVYADNLDGKVYHYRDKNGLECDAVIHLNNGKYGLIEIKLGGDNLIEAGAKTLNKLADKIDVERMKEPSFKMVLTGLGQYSYRRKDGVWVVPIGSLKY